MNIIPTDIRNLYDFSKYGHRFHRRSYNPDTDVYVYERYGEDKDGGERLVCLEVVKPVYAKLLSNERVPAYPSSEQFGTYGKCVDLNRYTDRMVDYYVNNPDKWGPEESHNYKMKLYAGQN